MKVIISTGGSGGHIYPALNFASYLIKNGNEVIFIGHKNSLEENECQKRKIEFFGLIKKRKINLKNIYLCLKLFKQYSPDFVVGFGSYVSFSALAAGVLSRKKIFLHEQNCTLGTVNKLFLRVCKKLFCSLPLKITNKKAILVGNPNAQVAITAIPEQKYKNIKSFKVLVVAGSLGSETMNSKLLDVINEGIDNIKFIIITGKNYYTKMLEKVTNSEAIVIPYSDNLPALFKSVNLVVSRAGASTISELLATRTPAVLIPSPYVKNNHQHANAIYMQTHGCATLIEECDIKEKLANTIKDYYLNTKKLLKMSENCIFLANTSASEKMYLELKEGL